jgi:hypothetical protein
MDVAKAAHVYESARHHTVPQVYLRRFQRRPRGLMVIRRGRQPQDFIDNPEFITVKEASAVDNFYTLLMESGENDPALEAQFSKFENFYPSLLEAIRLGRPLLGEDLIHLELLTALQDARSPAHRKLWAENFEGIVDLGERMYRHHRPDASEEEVADARRRLVAQNITSLPVRPDPENQALLMITMTMRARHHLMHAMHKCIITSRAHDFITSDSPVVWLNPMRYPPRPLRGFNFFHLMNEVVYPIDRRHCVLMSFVPLMPFGDAPEEVVSTANARVSMHAHEEVYVTPTDSPNARLQYALDLAAGDDIVRRPLLNYFINRADAGQIRLAQAAHALDAPMDEILADNDVAIETLNECFSLNIIVESPGDE